MYPVTGLYQDKIQERNRLFESKIQIQHSGGVLDLSDKDLALGSLTYTEGSQAGEEFTIGSTVASAISFTLMNKPEYEGIKFMGAIVTCDIGLEIKENIDAHFLQPSQPSKMPGYEGEVEYVPLGRFNIDDVNIQRNTIKLKAMDNMIKFDLPYSLSNLSYPATLLQIYVNACNVADVNVGTATFPNMGYTVPRRPEGDYSLRDIIGYVAELSGTFAKCNRNGALELRWYKPSGITLSPANRFNFVPRDDLVQIKGIMATVDDTTYLAGTDDYAVDLSDNPLLQGGYETVLPNIFNNVKNTVFTPFESSWQGNPALQAGDMITQIDIDGKMYNTLVTNSTYKYRGASTLSAKGLPEIAKGYKGSTAKQMANIVRKVEKEVGDRLTTIEQAQLAATELIANMLGGHAILTEDALYVADNEDLSLAQEVWKWGLGGFGYSKNGVNGPYDTAITADGSIVAMLVAANIITANMVQTGQLMSEDGGTVLNLDDGTFNFQNKLILTDGDLSLNGAILNGGEAYFTGGGNIYAFRPNSVFRMYRGGFGRNDIISEMSTFGVSIPDFNLGEGGAFSVNEVGNPDRRTSYGTNIIQNSGSRFFIMSSTGITLRGDVKITGSLTVDGYIFGDVLGSGMRSMQNTIDTLIVDSLEG